VPKNVKERLKNQGLDKFSKCAQKIENFQKIFKNLPK
jgi:hypothetical protein